MSNPPLCGQLKQVATKQEAGADATGRLERQSDSLIANVDCVMTVARRRVTGPNSEVLANAIGLAGLKGSVAGRTALRRALTLGANLFGEVSSVMFQRDVLQRQLP